MEVCGTSFLLFKFFGYVIHILRRIPRLLARNEQFDAYFSWICRTGAALYDLVVPVADNLKSLHRGAYRGHMRACPIRDARIIFHAD